MRRREGSHSSKGTFSKCCKNFCCAGSTHSTSATTACLSHHGTGALSRSFLCNLEVDNDLHLQFTLYFRGGSLHLPACITQQREITTICEDESVSLHDTIMHRDVGKVQSGGWNDRRPAGSENPGPGNCCKNSVICKC